MVCLIIAKKKKTIPLLKFKLKVNNMINSTSFIKTKSHSHYY